MRPARPDGYGPPAHLGRLSSQQALVASDDDRLKADHVTAVAPRGNGSYTTAIAADLRTQEASTTVP